MQLKDTDTQNITKEIVMYSSETNQRDNSKLFLPINTISGETTMMFSSNNSFEKKPPVTTMMSRRPMSTFSCSLSKHQDKVEHNVKYGQQYSSSCESNHGAQQSHLPCHSNQSSLHVFDSNGKLVLNDTSPPSYSMQMSSLFGFISPANVAQQPFSLPPSNHVISSSWMHHDSGNNNSLSFLPIQHHIAASRSLIPGQQYNFDVGRMTSVKSSENNAQFLRSPMSKNISLENVRPLFHRPLAEAAQHFGICTTLFKKVCRRLHIKKWPYRQINSLVNRMNTLEHCLRQHKNLPESTKQSYREQLDMMTATIEKIKDDAVIREDGNGVSGEGKQGRTTCNNNTKSVQKSQGRLASTLEEPSSSLLINGAGPITENKRQKVVSSNENVRAGCIVAFDEMGSCSNSTVGPMTPQVLVSGDHSGYFH